MQRSKPESMGRRRQLNQDARRFSTWKTLVQSDLSALNVVESFPNALEDIGISILGCVMEPRNPTLVLERERI